MHGPVKSVLAVTAATVMLALGLAGPAESAPVAPAGQSASAAAPTARVPTTRITLRVKHCRRCPVYLQQALDDGTYWTSKTHRVRAGHARFRVPTKRTHGLTFVFVPRWDDASNAVTNVVTRYANTRVGDNISNRVAAHKRRATACWAGTDARRVRMVVRAVRFQAPAIGGGQGHALRAWFNPMKSATPYWNRTYRGSLGNQDAYFCRS